ncbi:MAG: hypothetical protein C0432_01825 [Candidatus Puniceispirillum sp.]|nr:hypothetical protein [Candidatus Pelagibacter sp.]MBA4283014.1 hypothetical protein [Candidatus Puniceispirillum sp.]
MQIAKFFSSEVLHDFSRLKTRFIFALSSIAIVLASMTYMSLIKNISKGLSKDFWVMFFFALDILIILFLIFLIAVRIRNLWINKQKKGSKLHFQIISFFSFSCTFPALVLAYFSFHFLNAGVNTWLAKPVKDALNQAHEVATAYLKEHKKSISYDIYALAEQLRPNIAYYAEKTDDLTHFLNQAVNDRQLSEILVFKENKRNFELLARSFLTFLPLLEDLNKEIKKTKKENFVITESKDRVRAILKLDHLTSTYLLIGKLIDPVVLQHVDHTKHAVKDYRLSSQKLEEIQMVFIFFFCIGLLLLLLTSILWGLAFADKLIKPISELIQASELVSSGDLSVRINASESKNEIDDLCRTFNKMIIQLFQQKQDLIISEKKATWSDVARKIAHEIKNPLTPIQLSAERLKRKYLHQIEKDPTTFEMCIDTIIRQVSNIGNLVTEFSNFARMPEPKFERVNIVDLISEAILIQKQSRKDVIYSLIPEGKNFIAFVDPYQMIQVLTNLLLNATHAIEENILQEQQPQITIKVISYRDRINIQVDDNGPGFLVDDVNKLLEPYFTTRQNGTGLGLSIVYKIVSDHAGKISLSKSLLLGGARVEIDLPVNRDEEVLTTDENHM